MRNIYLLALAGGITVPSAVAEGDKHTFGLQSPIWFRAKASFTGFQLSDFGANDSQGSVNRTYLDGYNYVDSTGNAALPEPPAPYSFPRTSNFKFVSMAQVMNDPNPFDSEAEDPDGGTLALHSLAVKGGDFSKARDSEIVPGLELFYRYEMVQRERWSFGMEAGASLHHFQWELTNPAAGTLDLITDFYPLGGVVLRERHAGQEGVFEDLTGRKPAIGSVPRRTTRETIGTILGQHEMDLDALVLRLGPTFTWRAHERFSLNLLVGLSLAFSQTEYRYAERTVTGVSINGSPATVPPQQGEVIDHATRLGFYSGLRANYHFNERWSAQFEVRHVLQDPISIGSNFGSARVDLSQGMAIAAGIAYRF